MEYEIEKFNPCKEAIGFRKEFKSFKDAWDACPRGDWMLWLASKLKVDKRLLTLTKGYCAKTVEHLMKDERSINAVDAAIAFGEGKISREELNAAAAYAAAYAAADAKINSQKMTADICRQILTNVVLLKYKELK